MTRRRTGGAGALGAFLAVSGGGLALATLAESGILDPGQGQRREDQAADAAAAANAAPRIGVAIPPNGDPGAASPSGGLPTELPGPSGSADAAEAVVPSEPASGSGGVGLLFGMGDGAAATAALPGEAIPPGVGVDDGSGQPQVVAAEIGSPGWVPASRATERGGCRVVSNRTLVATGVARREPVGTEGPYLANGEPLFLYVDTANATGVDQRLTARWQRGDVVLLDTFTVGPISRFRTWVDRALLLEHLGEWTAQIVDEDGCLVSEVVFELAAPDWDQ